MVHQEILSYLPKRIAGGIQYYLDHGKRIEEIRFHRNEPILLVIAGENVQSGMICSEKEFDDTFLSFCEQSVYAHADTVRRGYISVAGGYRVGVGGDAVVHDQEIFCIRSVSCMNLRLAQPHGGVAEPLYQALQKGGFCESVLVYAPPGIGKTTLLRDLARRLATPPHQKRVCVIDSRKEFQLPHFTDGTCIDLLSGYPKKEGMEIAIRTLCAQYMICDEIGNEGDADAVLHSVDAGVHLCAAAHAVNVNRLLSRPFFADFHQKGVFDYYCGIRIEDGERRLILQKREEFL